MAAAEWSKWLKPWLWFAGLLAYLRLFVRTFKSVVGQRHPDTLLPTSAPRNIGAGAGGMMSLPVVTVANAAHATHASPLPPTPPAANATPAAEDEPAEDWNAWSKSAEDELAAAVPDREQRKEQQIDSLFAEMAPAYVQPKKLETRLHARKRDVAAHTVAQSAFDGSRLAVDESFAANTEAAVLGDWDDDDAGGGAWGAGDDVDVSEVLKEKRRQQHKERRQQHEQRMQQQQAKKEQQLLLAARKLPTDKTK